MFNLGMPELILIFVVALLVFGPKKLPELGKSLGRAIGEFKRTSQEIRDTLETEVETDKIRDELVAQQKEVQQSLTDSPYPEVQQSAPSKTDDDAKPAADA